MKLKTIKHDKSPWEFVIRMIFLILGLLALGIVAMFAVVNTVVRGIVYESVAAQVRLETTIHAEEIERWLTVNAETVRVLGYTLVALPDEDNFQTLTAHFVQEHPYFESVFIGLNDGRMVSGGGWQPTSDWALFDRPWFYLARDVGNSQIIYSGPMVSASTGNFVVITSIYLPSIGVVVGGSIPVADVLHELMGMHVASGDGFLVLMDSDRQLIAYPQQELYALKDRLAYHEYGEFISFVDDTLGLSYLITTPMRTVGWTLAAIVPVETLEVLSSQNLMQIIYPLVFLLAVI